MHNMGNMLGDDNLIVMLIFFIIISFEWFYLNPFEHTHLAKYLIFRNKLTKYVYLHILFLKYQSNNTIL